MIVTQGHGTFGKLPVSTPSMIRFGQMTEDELFVTEDAAAPACGSRTTARPIRCDAEALRPGQSRCGAAAPLRGLNEES